MIEINPFVTVGQIKQVFSLKYPFLKLEIFTCIVSGKTCTGNCFASDSKLLSEIQPSITTGRVHIDQNIKVKELEKTLLENFSLRAQVFRRSGKLWLETTSTDNWSLKQQNDHAKHSCENKNPAEKLEDYELTRDAD